MAASASLRVTAGASGGFNSPHWSAGWKANGLPPRDRAPTRCQSRNGSALTARFGLVRVGLVFPSYSPDGDRVTGSRLATDLNRYKGHLVMNADGSGRKLIYESNDGLYWEQFGRRAETESRFPWATFLGCLFQPRSSGDDSPERYRSQDAHERRAKRCAAELVSRWQASGLPFRYRAAQRPQYCRC